MSENTDPRAAVLRAAGHSDAADMLDAMSRLGTKPEPGAPQAEQPEQPTTPMTYEQQREAEGRVLLEKMQQQLNRQWVSSPLESQD